MQSPTERQTDEHVPIPDHGDGAPDAVAPLDWHPVEHTHLPQPTYWPAVLALAITFLAWSIVTAPLIAVVGIVLFALAGGGWIGDLLHEH